jgi:vitamin B12 transporter
MPSPSFASGERLIRRPEHSAELALSARLGRQATIGGSVTYVGRRSDVDFHAFPSRRVELPAYALVDVTAQAELIRGGARRPGISGLFRIENLFNAGYDQVVGFSGRGRAMFGGVRFRFQ